MRFASKRHHPWDADLFSRLEQGRIALCLHRRTPIDVFVYEPFDFAAEYAAAARVSIEDDLAAPFVTRESLLAMKRLAGRPQDLADIAALEEIAKINESSGNEPS